MVTIGGGSSYTPELVEGFIKRYAELPVRELWLVDIEEGQEKMEIVGSLVKRMVKKSGLPIAIHTTLNRREALANFMPYYNEISNIPLIVHMPGNQYANTRRKELTQNIDLMPTILEFENISLPKTLTGKSIFTVLEGNGKIHDYVLYGCHGLTVNICDGEYTYFWWALKENDSPEEQFERLGLDEKF